MGAFNAQEILGPPATCAGRQDQGSKERESRHLISNYIPARGRRYWQETIKTSYIMINNEPTFGYGTPITE
jgi:hypothetical protein